MSIKQTINIVNIVNIMNMIITIFLIIFIQELSCSDNYHCWEPSERKILTFENNPYKNMTHLPTIRLIDGAYPSQNAMQYAAYVYLREKMGVDVS